ncbi:MAG: TraR/DksA family transcriptional regulator [Proteobacteria bacterium]|jgi:DnaK suppressor protein|nr:TraR/DksA family transcriptional regulator [Pseudomonadota bacterium]
MAKKNFFTKKELTDFKDVLEEKRAEVLKTMKTFEENERARGDYQPPADLSDAATAEIESTFQFRMHDKNRKLLNEVENALQKFEQGTYGICEGTGDYISKERLKVRPWTKYSIEYKEYLDEQKRKEKI